MKTTFLLLFVSFCQLFMYGQNPLLGHWVFKDLSSDKVEEITVTEDSILFFDKSVKFNSEGTVGQIIDGVWIDTYCRSQISYTIDSILFDQHVWISTKDKIGNECSKWYFFVDYPFLYVSHLKK